MASSVYSVAEALFRLLDCDEVAATLQAANLSPEVLTAIEVASVAVREDSKKRRFMAADGSDTDEDLSEDEEGLCWGNKRFVIRKIEDGHIYSNGGAAETFSRASEKLQQVSERVADHRWWSRRHRGSPRLYSTPRVQHTRPAPAPRCQDKEVALAALKMDARIFEDLPAELQEDKEVVMAAVQRDGHALQYASEALKQDEDVLMAAMQHKGDSLQFVLEGLNPQVRTGDRAPAGVFVV